MSDIRFNRWLHQSGTGGVSQDSSGNIGIGTTVPTMALDVRGDVNIGNTININNASGIISATTFTGTTGTFSGNVSAVDGTFTGNVTIGGTLTYEDVANIDAVGIITAQSDILIGRNLNVTGVSTGTKFNSTTSPNYVISDGTTEKGYIGYNANDPFIGRKNGVGLAFQNNKVRPVDGDNGSPSSNTVDLGEPTYKFKDAYLTGTVNSAGINATGVATATTFSGNLTGNVTGDLTGNLAGISSIAAISSSITDTAVDVFVYDTRKDSDGGAWRKRTQHTSWYNETLNTATRGSRREFPAVAVIVVETGQVTIYDGDDPDLPMWMVFNGTGGGASHNLLVDSGTFCLSALNGTVFMGALGIYVNFISEYSRGHRNTGGANYWNGPYNGNIAERNAGKGSTKLSDKLILGGSTDVAMTVLPNAPIDDATGLPVPTIAVATGNGVSVIKDDGIVVDITSTKAVNDVELVHFDKAGRLYFAAQSSSSITDVYHYSRYTIPSADITNNVYADNSDATYYPRDTSGASFQNERPNFNAQYNDGVNEDITHISSNDDGGIVGNVNGLSIFAEDYSVQGNGMVAYAATSYNTGYMHGDCKGAFLSDTDTTNATYTTVADDWATASAWTKQSSISLTSTGSGTSGTVSITGNGTGSNVYFFNPITVEANTDYVVTITFGAYHANDFFINTTQYSTSNQVLDIHGLSGLTRGGHFNSGSNTTLYIQGYQVSTTATTITNVVVQKVSEKDRSANNKGLQVYGTVTKSAVATGAELVGYSGFQHTNPDNYLKQPYNSDLDFGTGDFSVTWWQYITGDIGSSQYVYDRQGGNGNRHAVYYTTNNSGSLAFYTVAGSASEILATGINSYKDGWACYTVSRGSSGLMEIYVNGELKQSTTLTVRNLTNTSAELFIGIRHSLNTDGATQAKYALMRFSKSIPSPEQIKKIYNDEKHLFQENAKATLYGSSDAVTALAYDEDTELLHVGTSSGRSDFQGLRRINNTTTAVTTAISASDDLIAEQ